MHTKEKQAYVHMSLALVVGLGNRRKVLEYSLGPVTLTLALASSEKYWLRVYDVTNIQLTDCCLTPISHRFEVIADY